jgi:hypothetical protein
MGRWLDRIERFIDWLLTPLFRWVDTLWGDDQ